MGRDRIAPNTNLTSKYYVDDKHFIMWMFADEILGCRCEQF